MVPVKLPRFSNSESKAVIEKSVRAQDVYILSDVGNYDCTYRMYGFINHKSVDDHFQDIKRVIKLVLSRHYYHIRVNIRNNLVNP